MLGLHISYFKYNNGNKNQVIMSVIERSKLTRNKMNMGTNRRIVVGMQVINMQVIVGNMQVINSRYSLKYVYLCNDKDAHHERIAEYFN